MEMSHATSCGEAEETHQTNQDSEGWGKEGIMELKLSTEEQQLLLDILEQRHKELLKEISHTAHREFKQGPRKNEQLLESMMSRLRGVAAEELRA